MINDMIQHEYHDKGVDFSASDFTLPTYQLWVKTNNQKPEGKQNLQAWVGQLVHKASYEFPEINVMKEYSPVHTIEINGEQVSIGGSIDRVVYNGRKWTIEDIKTQGMYPAKKAFKDGGKDEWITQLSVYRWLLESQGFAVNDVGVIHQYVMGFQKNKDGMEDYNEILINLMTVLQTNEMIANKIDIATGDEPVYVDCESWRCESYCNYTDVCPAYQRRNNK